MPVLPRRAMGLQFLELGGSGLPPYLCADRCATAPTGGVRPRGRARPARAGPRGGAHRHSADGRARPRRAEAAIALSSPSSGASLPRRRQSRAGRARASRRQRPTGHARLGRDPAAIGRSLASQLGDAGPARWGGTRGAFPVRGLLLLDLRSGVGANVRPAGNHLSRGVVVGMIGVIERPKMRLDPIGWLQFDDCQGPRVTAHSRTRTEAPPLSPFSGGVDLWRPLLAVALARRRFSTLRCCFEGSGRQ